MNEKFARWNTLFVQYLKRDWKKIVIWVLGLGLFSGGFIPAFKEMAEGQGLIGMFETLKNPAMISMVGPTSVDLATDYTLGAMYAHEMLLFCGLFAMITAALHTISHTRKEEELGLTELVRSFQVGRQANSLAVIVEIVFIHIILAIFIGGLMSSFRAETITVDGSFLFGASVGMAGVIGAGIALVMAQIMPTSSSATGSTLGIIGLLYIIRAGTDLTNVSLSAINPLGWIYLTYPYTENNWLFIIFAGVFTIIMILIAFGLEGMRDMGTGYLPEKEGRATAKKSLLSVQGLLIRLNKGIIISWLLAFFILGLAYGSIYGDMQIFIESNDLVKQMFAHEGVTIEESFTSTIMMVMISMVAILPIAIVNKLFLEESRFHFSQLYAAKVSRGHMYFISIIIAVIVSLIGIFLSSIGLGIAAIIAMGQNATMDMLDFLAIGFNLFPIVLFFISLASIALGFAPKLGKFVYVYLTYSFLLNYFGSILKLPDWFFNTAIQSFLPQMPTDSFDLLIFMILTIISIVLIFIGYLGYNRRDLLEG